MMRCAALLLVSSVLLAQSGAADPTVASPEKAVTVALSPAAEVYVAWLPPTEGPADVYRVYGIDGATKVLLNETSLYFASVPDGYAAYGVAAVYGTAESAVKEAEECVGLTIDPYSNPPDVTPTWHC